MTHRRTHRLRHTIAVLAILAGFVGGAAWLLNRPETLHHALALVNVAGIWKFDVARLHWEPLASRLTVEGISAEHRATGRTLAAHDLRLHYRLLGLLRGRLVIDELTLSDVRVSLPPQEQPLPPKRINLTKLILLKNLELDDVRVDGFSIAFGKGNELSSAELRIAMIPSIFGEARLKLDALALKLETEGGNLTSAAHATLSTSTRIERWSDDFPYVDAIRGSVELTDAVARGLAIEKAAATVAFEHPSLSLENFNLSIKGRELLGKLDADLADQAFSLDVEIPRPIELPYLGAELATLSTAGELSGKIHLEGRGFTLKTLQGMGQIQITHRFDVEPEAPLSVTANATVGHGTLQLTGVGKAGADAFELGGSIDLAGRAMDLTARGKRFPIEHVFTKFRNPHLARIFGPTDFEGTVKGWGTKFVANVKGTTYGGGWRPITVDRAEAEFTATYDLLHLVGDIFQKEKKAGHADLSIRIGPRGSAAARPMTIDFTANIADMPLDGPLAPYGLTGLGTGAITIKGPTHAFTGALIGAIDHGDWYGVDFDRASMTMDLSPRALLFHDMEVALPAAAATKLPGKLTGDIVPAGLRLHGEPIEGLAIDASYRGAASRWQIANISWTDPAMEGAKLTCTGGFVSGGPLDLKIAGRLNAARLALATTAVRDATGPLDVDLALRGTSARPQIMGSVRFNGNSASLRTPRISLAELSGALRFDGSRVIFEKIAAETEDGTVAVEGTLEQQHFLPSSANLSLVASGMRYRSDDRTLSLEFDGRLSLEGSFPQPLLAGDITILDGKYTKDFTLIDMLSGDEQRKREAAKQTTTFNPRIALKIRNSGDMAIRNNVGDIWLNLDIAASGTRAKPIVSGAITAANGEIHYLGVNFDITKGFVEFRGDVQSPYFEVYAQKDVGIYSVNLALHGPTDNLALDLSATSPAGALEKRDVVSLLLFGATEQERTAAAAGRAGGGVTTSMVASSLSGVIERPISKFTHLDVFRLEAAEAGSQGFSRISLGKQVSDRLTFKFATDIGKSNATQTFATEYQITDNLLLKGSRSTDSTSEISGLLRFQLK